MSAGVQDKTDGREEERPHDKHYRHCFYGSGAILDKCVKSFHGLRDFRFIRPVARHFAFLALVSELLQPCLTDD